MTEGQRAVIGLVLVSHSSALAEGLGAVVEQMAPDVAVVAAGGGDDGGIGTSFDTIKAAIEEADAGEGALILYDLGSAKLTSEMVLEMLDPDRAGRLRIVDAPLVEGALAAATVITPDVDLDTVAAAARDAAATKSGSPDVGGPEGGGPGVGDPDGGGPGGGIAAAASREVRVRNPLGLHARPAGVVTRSLRELEADVRVRTGGASADARSVLALVGLGTKAGDRLTVVADGPDARTAVDRVADLVEEGFGEADGSSGTQDADPVPATTEGTGAEDSAPSGAPSPVEAGAVLSGRRASPGGGLGAAAQVQVAAPELPTDAPGDVDDERERLRAAIDRARAAVTGGSGSTADEVFAVHQQLLDDPALVTAAVDAVTADRGAARGWWDTVTEQRGILERSGTEFLAARAADVADVGLRVLRELGVEVEEPAPEPGTVVIADDVTPSRVTELHEAGIAALVTTGGSPTSHAAVIARSLGLPMVVGIDPGITGIDDGTRLLVDADAATVTVEPDTEQSDRFRDRLQAAAEERERLRARAHEPVVLPGGRRVRIGANVATAADARAAVEGGAEEVGLLRTEFLFTDRGDVPDEEEQTTTIAATLEALEGRPAVVRTMDVGGDKRAPALGLDPVRNGFLGRRGLRWCLTRPDVFIPHLRAILRASEHHRVRLMFPFVTTAEEIAQARAAVDEAASQLSQEDRGFARPEQIGVMLEVPGAALRAAELAASVDFFSIGSNDLVQYLTAADRTLAEVSDLAGPDNAGLLDVVERVVEAAHGAGIWTGVCGELAADPAWASRLLAAGVDELSMSPAAIPGVKEHLRSREG